MKDWLIAFGVTMVYVLIIVLTPMWFALPVGIAVIHYCDRKIDSLKRS